MVFVVGPASRVKTVFVDDRGGRAVADTFVPNAFRRPGFCVPARSLGCDIVTVRPPPVRPIGRGSNAGEKKQCYKQKQLSRS